MKEHRGSGPSIAQLLAELERVVARGRVVEDEAARLRAENHTLRLERDRLVAESTRRGVRGHAERGRSAGDAGELRELRERARALERERRATLRDAATLKKRSDDMELELRRLREETATSAEERTCLEEQIEQLTQLVHLLTAENRVLRSGRRPH